MCACLQAKEEGGSQSVRYYAKAGPTFVDPEHDSDPDGLVQLFQESLNFTILCSHDNNANKTQKRPPANLDDNMGGVLLYVLL